MRLSALAGALLLGLTLAPAHAQSDNAAFAETLFRDGQRLMKEGKIAEACAKFRASYATDPALGTLLNLAVCNEKQGKTATAWTQFSEVRAKAVQLGQADREAFARTRQAVLEPRLVRVMIKVAERLPGMKLRIDGAELPAATFGVALPLDPGTHEIEVAAPAFKSFRQSVSLIEGGALTKVAVPMLEPIPGASAAGAGVPEGFTVISVDSQDGDAGGVAQPAASLSTRRIASLALLGAGAAGLATAGVFGLRTLGLVSDRDALCPPGALCRDQRAMQLHDSAETSQVVGFAALGAGVAAAGVGAWLLLFEAEPEVPGTLSLLPDVAPGAVGVSVGGAW